MNYRTRHLEAVTDCPMGNAYYTAGQRFSASEVDAEYLLRTNRAKEVSAPVAQPAPAAAPTAPPRRGRPPKIRDEPEPESTTGATVRYPLGHAVDPIKFADTPTGQAASDTTSDA